MAAGFRLPGSTYEDLVNIIVAYGTRDEASNPGDVGKLNAVHQTSVSRTNAFLVEIDILRGQTKKLVTRQGRTLALALAHGNREEIRRNWRLIVSKNEFLQNVVSAVKLREGMLSGTVQAYIAHAAGQPRNKPVMTGAATIVEILKVAGLLREQAGELVPTFDEEIPDDFDPDLPIDDEALEKAEAAVEPEVSAVVTESISTNGSPPGPEAAPGSATVHVHLHVRCDVDDLEDVAPRVRALLQDLSG
jgi:hypothetical protein